MINLDNIFWIYGWNNEDKDVKARKHRITGTVQIRIWKAGDVINCTTRQHLMTGKNTHKLTKDKYYNSHSSHWHKFIKE